MILPSIDLMDGAAVQLIGGRETKHRLGDPRPIARRLALAGEIAVVDLDAALGRGSNASLIRELLELAPCRVGGGIRSEEAARAWLDAGATSVVLGTAAEPELLRQLPGERVVAALDAVDGEVVVEGWQRSTGRRVEQRMAELAPFVGGFLVTFVEREGRRTGIDAARVEQLLRAAGGVPLTVAGGVHAAEEVGALDRLGVATQVGMALYEDPTFLADALAAPLVSDRPDGLWPTVVADECGLALGLAWSDRDSLRAAVAEGRGVYRSRTRGRWVKGETSGDVQELLRVELDCDRDALRFTVRQHGRGFCHLGTRGCFGEARGLSALLARLEKRAREDEPGSYTRRLLADEDLLGAKLVEEAGELARARGARRVREEAADLVYFAAVALARAGVGLDEVERELDRRALRVTRRPGDAKPESLEDRR